MKIGVIGPREFNNEIYANYSHVEKHLNRYKESATAVVSGGGKGTEQLVEEWTKKVDKEFELVRPNIKQHGNAAFRLRNEEIIRISDFLVYFWDGKNDFIHDFIKTACRFGKEVHVIPME
jgi:hypothetical protein